MPGASSWKGMSVMTPGGTAAELYFQSMLTLHKPLYFELRRVPLLLPDLPVSCSAATPTDTYE